MKKSNDKFMNEVKKDKELKKLIDKNENKNKNIEKELEETTMCFFCRNKINLTKFDKPYGKTCCVIEDYFYINSADSSLKNELKKVFESNLEKFEFYDSKMIKNNIAYLRIVSCGHYMHESCFLQSSQTDTFYSKCPLCEKPINNLLPPFTYFYGKDKYFNPIKLINILNRKEIIKKNKNKDFSVFKAEAIKNITLIIVSEYDFNIKYLKYSELVEGIFMNCKSYINFLINLYFSEGTTFQKKQLIDNIRINILSIRYLINFGVVDITEVMSYIHKIIDTLIEGPNNNINIIKKFENCYYDINFDKLLFSFLILLDFDEFKKIFKYIINWLLPYLSLWLCLRHYIVLKNEFCSLHGELIEKISIDDFKQYLKDNNKQMNDYIILYLKKLVIISELTKIDNKNNEDNYNIKEISIQDLFSLLNMENIYQSVSKNDNGEIVFIDLIDKLPKILTSEIKYKNNVFNDYDKIFNSMINNIKNIKQEKYLVKINILSNFIPYIFEIIELIHY